MRMVGRTDALRLLADSPEFRQQFGDTFFQSLEERAARLTEAYNEAGWQGSVTAGVEGGRFAVDLVSALTAVSGGAKIVAKLPSAAKTLVNAIAEAPVAGGRASQIGAIGNISGAKATGSSLDNVASSIHSGQQGKHILGHNNFIPGRSHFNEGVDPQKAVGWCSCREISCCRLWFARAANS